MRNIWIALGIGGILTTCGTPPEEVKDSVIEVDSTEIPVATDDGTMAVGDLTLTPLPTTAAFPDAALRMTNPTSGKNYPPGDINFNFEVKGFNLGEATPDENAVGLAASKDGQHIHLILNNQPYMALYENKTIENLQEGEYLGIAFLSRSYHESLKWDNSAVPFAFTVGGSQLSDPDILKKPLLFYSRPKGEYAKGEYDRLLVDFYLVNARLTGDGGDYRVVLTVDNEHEFVLDKWRPFILRGLQAGKHTVKLQLTDKNGEPVNETMNTVEREIELK